MKKLLYILPLVLLLTSCEKKTPKMVMITNISILEYPLTNNDGISWDDTDAADLFFIIQQNEHAQVPEQYYTNVTPTSLPLRYELSNGTIFNDLTNDVYMILADHDLTESELISHVKFNWMNYLEKNIITINQNGISLVLFVEWYY